MDLGKTLTDGLTGLAGGLVGGPIGMAVGLIGGIAPDLLSLFVPHLAGPAGEAVANAVTDAVAVATGVPIPASSDVAAMPPDQRAALQVQLAQIACQAETNRLAADQARWNIQLEEMKAAYADTFSARARDVAVRTADGGRNVRADIMLAAVTVGLLACIISTVMGKLDGVAFGLVAGIAGMLSGCFKDAFGFEFGSSRQSEAKTDIISDMSNQLSKSIPIDHVAAVKTVRAEIHG